MELHVAALTAGFGLIAFDSTGSTSAEAMRRGRAGERGPLWVTALEQTAGRGRRGRTWVSQRGNLYTSLLLTDPAPLRHAAELSFVAALAVHDAVVESAPACAPRLTLKWPNDVLYDGAKIGGILIEGEGSQPLIVSIGIGVNCRSHPAETAHPATDLAAAGHRITAEALFKALSASMASRLHEWDRGTGFPSIRSSWMARAHGRGSMIRVRLPDRELIGRFRTLDEAGRLIVELPDGRTEIVTAGEVFALPAGAPAREA